MKKNIFVFVLLFQFVFILGQESNEEKKFGISFSGFVKNDVFLDARQTVAAREGHFLLWPSNENLDEFGEDINAKPNLNILAVQSRLSGKITGPDAFGAKTSGVIEGDFFAQLNDNVNLFRLRHAFLKLSWPTVELITGQYWNPLFVTASFPGTVSFNTGTPLQSFARNPQIRLTKHLGNLSLVGAMLAQRDYTSRGEIGASSAYLRNAAIPDLHFQVHYGSKTNFFIGAGVAYKTIVPRLSSTMYGADTLTYKVDESVSGLTLIGFSKIKLDPLTVKLHARYGENIPDVLSISGFAVKNVINPITGEREYTPLTNLTFWGEVHTNGEKIQVGIFAGYLQNLGTRETMSSAGNDVYGLGTNIESLLRISPRFIWNSNKVRIALEWEYTMANYGSNYDVNFQPASTTTVSNLRTLLSTYYFF